MMTRQDRQAGSTGPVQFIFRRKGGEDYSRWKQQLGVRYRERGRKEE